MNLYDVFVMSTATNIIAPKSLTLDDVRDAMKLIEDRLKDDPEARNLRHTHVETAKETGNWLVDQMLIDPDALNDWMAAFEIDLARSRERQEAVLRLLDLRPLL